MSGESMYSEKVMDHFNNPRNVGKMEDPDGVGTVGNPVCGDVMKLYIKVDDGRISDAKFQTFGCGAAIATIPSCIPNSVGRIWMKAPRRPSRCRSG